MKLAINPLQFYATAEGGLDFANGPSEAEVAALVAAAGFRAVQGNMTPTEPAGESRARLARIGLEPAPRYFAALLDRPEHADATAAAFRAAATYSRDLGLDVVTVACDGTPEREALAGRAHATPADRSRVERIAVQLDGLGRIAAQLGLRVAFHQHAGTAIESPEETELLLALTDARHVGLCLDTGHLAWGGCADVNGFLARWRERVFILHLKDASLDVLARGRSAGWNYRGYVRNGLWREPGDGDLDLARTVRGMEGFGGWTVIEVDAPARPTAQESLEACWRFAVATGLAAAVCS